MATPLILLGKASTSSSHPCRIHSTSSSHPLPLPPRTHSFFLLAPTAASRTTSSTRPPPAFPTAVDRIPVEIPDPYDQIRCLYGSGGAWILANFSPIKNQLIMKKFHGSTPRGLLNHPSSPAFEGVFGRIFRTLPKAHFSDKALEDLGAAMVAGDEGDDQTPETKIDDEENPAIDAGYTYFGQFIDHDLTFDPNSSLQKQNDPEGTIDFRSPRFDLDNLYGRGPDDQPYMYAPDGVHFVLGAPLTGNDKDPTAKGLPRNGSDPMRAIIGDPRNDENVIVSQLQASMLRFHNLIADILTKENPHTTFAHIQQTVRWHYQWVVIHDFLPTIVGQAMVDSILPHLKSGKSIHQDKPKLTIYSWEKDPFIPVEFSVAAYRFGHSMVRPIYRLNQTLPDRQMIFASDPNKSLNGFRQFPLNWAIDCTSSSIRARRPASVLTGYKRPTRSTPPWSSPWATWSSPKWSPPAPHLRWPHATCNEAKSSGSPPARPWRIISV